MSKTERPMPFFRFRLMGILILFSTLLISCSASRSGLIIVDPSKLESFADDFFAKRMDDLHIPGLTIVVVQNSEILLAKGYGSSSLANGGDFVPDQTVVRIGSVSKLFVATSVMQMVERGLLDLDADINTYLTTFQVEDTYPEPITLANLLTHTSGIQDPPYVSNMDPDAVEPLGSYLANHLPPRMAAAGEEFVYSNHGYALAAYVVEKVSGTSFDQYVLENILQPLDMENSKYLMSPPLPEELAVGYAYVD